MSETHEVCALESGALGRIRNYCTVNLKEESQENSLQTTTPVPGSSNEHTNVNSIHYNEHPVKFYCKNVETQDGNYFKPRLKCPGTRTGRRFKCDQCNYAATTITSLRAHVKIHITISEPPFKCKICNWTGLENTQLLTHMKKHSKNINSYECLTCGKLFLKKSDMTCHVRKHTGERPYKCDMCDYAAARFNALSQHLTTHADDHDRPFKCDTCDWTGMRNSYLVDHIRSKHSQERPYAWEVCNKGFAKKKHLACHEKIHVTEKPFVCEVCDKGFSQKCNMTHHMRIHSGDRPYKCQKCDWSGTRSNHLTRHMQSRHAHERDDVVPELDVQE